MVNTAEVQLSLRSHLYGIRMLFCPKDRQLKALGDLRSDYASISMLRALIHMQRRVELDTYAPAWGSPLTSDAGARLLDMQNGTRLLEDHGVSQLDDGDSKTWIATHVLGFSSSFTWCMQDAVILEARG
jgi:hypothetical protein